METQTTQLHGSAVKAVRKYLEAQSYEVMAIEPTENIDIVAMDGDTLCFVNVRVKRDGFANARPTREQMENESAEYIKGIDKVDIPLRFDVASVNVIKSDKAMIRHYVNAFPETVNIKELLDQLLEDKKILQEAYDVLKEVLS